MTLPIRRAQFKTREFAAWLAANGAEVGMPTNPYEVIRYRAFWNGSQRALTHVVYAKESGLLTFSEPTREHYAAFLAGGRMIEQRLSEMQPAIHKENSVGKAARIRRKLFDRDGDECWFCGKPMGEDATIEHLVPRSVGGGNKLANYALAHSKCNHAAGDMPLVDKIALRTKMRSEASHA